MAWPKQVAIEPKTKADLDKMGTGLYKLAQEDPSFHFQRDDETNQTVIEVRPALSCLPRTFSVFPSSPLAQACEPQQKGGLARQHTYSSTLTSPRGDAQKTGLNQCISGWAQRGFLSEKERNTADDALELFGCRAWVSSTWTSSSTGSGESTRSSATSAPRR